MEETVKIGTKLFVPDKQKSKYGDFITGGLATIKNIKNVGSEKYAVMEETDNMQWHLDTLISNQDEYSKQYQGLQAKFHSEPFERDNFLW